MANLNDLIGSPATINDEFVRLINVFTNSIQLPNPLFTIGTDDDRWIGREEKYIGKEQRG